MQRRFPALAIGAVCVLYGLFALSWNLLITGCSLSDTAAPMPEAGSALQGKVYGGRQPISGAHVYLLAANTIRLRQRLQIVADCRRWHGHP